MRIWRPWFLYTKPSHESIKQFSKQAKQFQQAYNKMDFAEPNNQQHQLAEHVSYYLEMDHLNSMGKLSTEGNEAGNRRFKTEKTFILLLVVSKYKWNKHLDLTYPSVL